jgi:hypothetical protein
MEVSFLFHASFSFRSEYPFSATKCIDFFFLLGKRKKVPEACIDFWGLLLNLLLGYFLLLPNQKRTKKKRWSTSLCRPIHDPRHATLGSLYLHILHIVKCLSHPFGKSNTHMHGKSIETYDLSTKTFSERTPIHRFCLVEE